MVPIHHHEHNPAAVIITFNSNVPGFPILFADFNGDVGSCETLLAPGQSATEALNCLFKQRFTLVAFTSSSNLEITYTLKRH